MSESRTPFDALTSDLAVSHVVGKETVTARLNEVAAAEPGTLITEQILVENPVESGDEQEEVELGVPALKKPVLRKKPAPFVKSNTSDSVTISGALKVNDSDVFTRN